jgi:hypothetical protein
MYPSPIVSSSVYVLCFDPAISSCIVPGTSSGGLGTNLRNNVKVQSVARAHTLKKMMYQFPYE